MKLESQRQGLDYDRKVREEYNDFYNHPGWDWWRMQRAHYSLKFASANKPLNVMEVGCGIGFVTNYLAVLPRVARIVGVDTSRLALHEAALQATRLSADVRAKLDYRFEDYFSLAETNTFDLVFMHAVFEHLDSPTEAAVKAYDLLREGGVFVVTTPHRLRLSNRIRRTFGRAYTMIDPMHNFEPSRSEMIRWIQKAGFVVADLRVVGFESVLGLQYLRRWAPLVRRLDAFYLTWTRLHFNLGGLLPAWGDEIQICGLKGGG